jgi:hypothetical protein
MTTRKVVLKMVLSLDGFATSLDRRARSESLLFAQRS